MGEPKQCKDISDLPILEFLQMLENAEITAVYATENGLTAWQPSSAVLHEGFAHSVLNAIPYGSDYPNKLRVSKIKSMHRRGLIDGCVCGCRGDFILTDKGRSILAANESPRK